jgi:type III restriction enzyme
MSPAADNQQFRIDDFVLKVSPDFDRTIWDSDRYEAFLDLLCQEREYQKEAIRVALRYLLGGEYSDLRALAQENWRQNPLLEDRYGTWANFERQLQLPDKLSASIDLATGTGKSFVIYGIAVILLAEGAVDRVLVLCPSTTIETGLYSKFKLLAGSSDLESALPENAKLRVPSIIQADDTITPGCICVENRDAVYAHVKSSIKDSLCGKGARVAVLNDEAHHIANDPNTKATKWKEFLLDPNYGFNYVLGFSGTCYVKDNYFSDVIFRYSLRRAMDDKFVKKVKYLTDILRTGEEDEDWQLRVNLHERKRAELRSHNLLPLSIVVTPTIERCKEVGDELRAYLIQHGGMTEEDAGRKVLTVYNNAPDIPKLAHVDDSDSEIEWIVSVSMLNEGWDVRRVFQIVPHEERAFNSRLLISQVLGRGLRVPEGWRGTQPEVTVFNHASWAHNIKHLVNEILENEKTITARPLPGSPYNFELHNLTYNVVKRSEDKEKKGPFDLMTKGFFDIPTEGATVRVDVEFTNALNDSAEIWQSEVRRKQYTPEEVAGQMHHALTKLDLETASLEESERTQYAVTYPYERLLEVVVKSLGSEKFCTEANKQKMLQGLGTLRRKRTKVVRYELDPEQMTTFSTAFKPVEIGSAAQLRRDKVAFISTATEASIDEDELEFFREVIEEGGDYKHVSIRNKHDLKSPVTMVFGDHAHEVKFIKELLRPENNQHLDAWIKSTSMNFYGVDYAWKKGQHPKRGKFNPDFFLKVGELVVVVEIKDATELVSPSPENVKKNEYAVAHFARVNQELEKQEEPRRYSFHFLTAVDFPDFFSKLRADDIGNYRSKLDVRLDQELQETE